MENELKINKWYYLSLGMCGNSSTNVAPYEKTGRDNGGYICLSDAFNGGTLKARPMVPEYRAIGMDGRSHTISANDLGRECIGGLREDFDYSATIYRDDLERLTNAGYTEAEVRETFRVYNSETENYDGEKTDGLTARQFEMLKKIGELKDAEEKAAKEKADREYAEAVEKAKLKYHYIPCKKTPEHDWLTTGEISRNLRAVLAHEFTGVKFRVRSSSYSGGDSCTVRYVDGPAYEKVDAVVRAFGTSVHDFTGDYWDTAYCPTSTVCGGFSHTFLNREYSPELRNRARALIAERLKDDCGWRDDSRARELSRMLKETDFPANATAEDIIGVEYIEPKDRTGGLANFRLVFREKAAPVPPTGGGKGGKGNGTPDGADGEEAPSGASVTIAENTERNGIEIRFSACPSVEVRNELKARGWRWSRFGGCWYNRATEENREHAREIAERLNAEEGNTAAA